MAKKTTSTAAKKKEQQARLNQGGQNIANIAQNIVAKRQEQAVNKVGQQYGIRKTAGDMLATRALGIIQDREAISYRKRLEEEERRRREAEAARQQNMAGNLRSAAQRVNIGGMTGSPTQNKLKKSALETIMEGLGAKIENEHNIINNQGRAEDDPARIRADKELKELEKRRAETQEKIASIPGPQAGNAASIGMSRYTPEEEAYIQRLQKKLERGQSRKQTIPAVWNQDLKAIQHMRNAPEKAEGDEYIRWLQEGGQIGLTDKQMTNALIAQAGRNDDPLAQYMALDDSQKSGWLRSAGENVQQLLTMGAAKRYNQQHPYTYDRDELLAKQEYYTGLRDEAQSALDRMNGNIRIMYTPDGMEPVEIRGRSNPYYQQNPDAINEQFYDALVGQGEYRKRKAEFTDDPEGWEKADQLELQLTEAWDAYEQGRWNDAYRILTGKNNYAEMESQLGYANDNLNTIQGQLNLYDQYDAFMGGYTGAQRASYDPEKDRGFDSLVDYGTSNRPNHRPAYRDPNTKDVHRVYSFINQGKEYKAYYGQKAHNWDENEAKIEAVYGKAALMLPEEIEIFNGYYNAGKYQEASAFFNGLSMALNDRYSKYEEIENREQARQYPVLSSFGTLVAEQMSGALAIPRTFAGFAGEKSVYDPNSAWYASTRFTEQTQDEIANMIGGEGGKFYLQGMNTLRNMTNAAMVALAGVPASGQAAAGLAMFATQIYQDQTYKYLKETNDYGKATGMATLDAMLETMEEMLPYEVMLSGGGNIILNILANSTSEALEELTGATVGEAIKGLITGRQDWEKRRDQIFNEGGYTDDSGNWIALDAGDSNKALAEAQTQAWKEKGHEIIENTVAGFVGGSLGASYGAARGYLNTRSTGAQVNSREGGFNTLLNAARGMEENSATRKLAEQLYAKQQKGKTISNYQTGQLAQTMYQESGQEIRDVIEGAMTRKVESELKAEGASDEYAEQAAPIIAQTVTTGKNLRKADIRVIAKEDAGVILMESYMTGDRDAKESIKAAGGEAAMNAQQAVRDVLGETPAKAKRGPATEGLREFAPIAKQSDLESAEGPRHDNGLDAVVDGQIVSIKGRSGDNYTVIDENNEEHTVNKKDVQAADESLGLLMEYADRNRDIVDDEAFRELAVGLKNNQGMNLDDYLEQSTRAIINFRTGGTVRNSRLAAGTLNALKTVAQRQNDRWDEERIKKAGKQRKATPGKGIVTYNGIQAGTDEWETMAKKAGPILGGQLRLIGEIGVRLGNEIEIVEREDMQDAFGWEDPDTGKIYVNLAAENVKGQAGNRHILTVTAHELTHWLEQNSPEEYKALRDFVFSTLRKNGTNIANRVIERIDNFQGLMKRDMTVNEAMAEIVADACDQVLTNEQVARQLEAESPNLYQKIKTFVKNFIETVRSYAGHIDTSKESRKMIKAGQETLDELARIWLGARQEVLGRQEGNQAEAEEGDRAEPKEDFMPHSWREDELYNSWAKENEYQNDTRSADSLAAATDAKSPALTSKTTGRSLTPTTNNITLKENNVKGKYSKSLTEEEKRLNREYIQAIESGDIDKARRMLWDKITHTKGVYPFIVAQEHYTKKVSEIANSMKSNEGRKPSMNAIHNAAVEMARKVPNNVVLVPMPGRNGIVTNESDTMLLSKEISRITGAPVIVALEGNARESRHRAKLDKSIKMPMAKDMGFRQVAEIPKGKIPFIVDNVVSVGETAKAAIDAIPGSMVLAYAKGGAEKVTWGLKYGDVTKEKVGEKEEIIPFNKRINPMERDWRLSTREAEDQEYMDAVNSGDMATAQRMVDQAAKAAGYTRKVYHGTPNGGFNTFRDWSYFTENRNYAERYQSSSASSIRSVREGEGNRQVYELYMNPGKEFDTRKAKERKLFNEARMEYGLTSLDNMSRGLPDWTDGRDIIEYIEDNGLDYDTVILDEGADGGYGEEVRDRGLSYVTKSNMVKSAAPVVYDDAGNIIPLSERFNQEQQDIRYSTREAEDQGVKNLEKALAQPRVKFSMREPVEATKDGLVAVHNLRENEFYLSIQEGGLTAPSVAIVHARTGHNKYGDVSVVFSKDAIDPEKMLANRVYGADAWTPTRGNAKIYTKLDYDEMYKVRNRLEEILSGKDVVRWRSEATNWINQWISDDSTSDTLDDMIDRAYNNLGMIAAFNTAMGNEIEPFYDEVTVRDNVYKDREGVYKDILSTLEENGMLNQFMADMESLSLNEILDKYAQILKGAKSEIVKKTANAYIENTEERMWRRVLSTWIKGANEYEQDGREIKTQQVFNQYKTGFALKEKTDETGFRKWVKGLLGNVRGKRGVYNGKDIYTRSGDRRSFEYLHDEPTAENIVRAMYANHERKGGEAGGATGLMAKASKEYRSIEEIREDAENRLKVMDEEEYKQLVKDLDERIDQFLEEAVNNAGWDYGTIRESLIEAGGEYARAGEDAVRRYFKRENIKLTEKQINEALELMKTAQEIPAGYFEAKPERVVGLDEIARVILPATASQELFDAMDERGIPYDTYDGTDEDRLAKLNSVENVQFSTREMDSQYMQAVKRRDRATEQLMVDAQAIRSGFTTEDAFHGTASFGFNSFDMEASAGAIFVAYSPKIAGTYVDNGDVRMIGKKYPEIGLDIMSAEQLAEELKEYYRNIPKDYLGYETANEWTVKGIDKDDYVDFVFDYAENMKKLAAGKSFEKEVTRLVDKMVALAHTGDEKAAYQVGVDLQRKFRTADYFGQDELESRRIELSAMMIPALAKGEDVININMHGINYYLSRSDVIKQLEKYNQDKEGIYRFYTRPGNQLLIDAKGANWNKIWIEDEQLRNDMWTYFNQKEALEEAQGNKTYSKDMFTVTTRQISEYARYRKYSSVRINDVYDHGGRGDWDRERGHGDIAMFFNPNDVKSADPVTYDDDGKVVPLNKRFSDESNDLRFSMREPELEVNRWMMGLSESSLRTAQERMLWKQYKEVNGSWELTKRFIRELTEQMRKLEAKENKTAMDTFDIQKLQGQIEKWEEKRNEYEEQILKVTSDKGYAAIMYRERNKMENLLNGRTEDEVRQTIDAMQTELDTVEKEMAARNAKLKELSERENVKLIRNQLNSAGLRRIAAKLKNDLGSELQNKEIENRLALLALKMKQGKVDSTEIMELADMLVGSMKPAYDDYVLSELRGMTIGLNSSEQETLKNRGMNIRDLQRELTGTGIRVVAGGPNTIDKNWDELLVSFPTLDPAANPGDMLWGPDADHKGLMDLVEDAIRQQKAMGPDSDQVAAMVLEAASDLVPEILTDAKSMKLIRESMEFIAEINQSTEALDNMEDLFNRLRKKNANTKATLGKLENKIVDAIEYTNELAKQHDVTAWKHERRVIIDQLKDKHTKEILEIQTKYREKIAKDKKARDLMGDNNALRREIHRNISKYRRLIVNETDRENVPEAYKPLAREMLMKLIRHDLAADRKITVIDEERLADAFHFLSGMNARDGKFGLEDLNMLPEDIREEVADALANIEDGIRQYDADPKGKDIIENLKTYKDGLEQVAEAVNLITNVINKARSISYMDRERRLDDEAARVIRDMRRIKKELAGRGSKSANAVKRSVFYGNMTPVYFFKNLKNAGITDQWEEFEAAENKNGLELTKAKAFFDKVAEDCHYKSWDLDKEFTVKFNGFPVKITTEQIMALYATWQREKMIGPEESHHLETGGVIMEDSGKDKGKPRMERKQQKARKVKDGDMAAILQLLTNEQKVYVHKVVGYLSKEMSDLGNEASMRMYGIKKYNEKWYFPFKVWDGVLSARSDKGITGKDENRAAHKGWSKRRKNNAGNALVIGNFTDTAVKHVVEMINYNTFAPAIENLNKIMNYQTVEVDQNQEEERRNIRVMFQEAYGTEALRYMEDWMRDLQGGVTQDQRKTLRDRLISMFKKNAVAGSLSVTLQQPLSYIRAAMMINPKYLAGALSPQYWKGSYQEMLDHSGVAVIKQMGRFDMNFGQSAQDWIMPKAKPNAYEKISDVLTAAPQAADTMTWTRMWSAVKMEQHAAHPDMNIQSEEFLDLVGKRFNEVMRRTQVYDSTLTKSSNMRSQALSMKLITSFMAEPTLSLNVLADAVANVKEKGGKATLAKAGATYLLSAVLQAAVKGFMGAGRSPDEKKTAAENVLNKILYNLMSEANPASLIPGYSDLVEVLKNGELKDDALGVLGKLKSIYTTATNIMNPDKSKGPWRDVEDTLGQFVQLFSNIPLKNLMRDARAMYNWATGSKFADRPTSSAVLKYQAEETRMNGDNLLGVINSWLGDAGYKSTNKAYYTRMYNAMAGGNQGEADDIREYLELAKGQGKDKIESGLRTAAREDDSKTPAETSQWMIDNDLLDGTSSITTQYKKGEITREEAEGLYKAASPKMTDNDIFWKLDQMDYEKETGETETGYYYRLRDAITKNKAAEIQAAVKTLLAHGVTKEKIKDKLSDWKAEYTAGDSAKKIQIRDAITKAYKAAGYTSEDANKTIERWNKEAKKAEPEKKDAKDTTGRWGRGNIDLNNRKVVENDDGTISTERSFSVNIDGKEVLLPTVIDGKIVSEEEAIRHYEQTGQYLGKFNTVKEAEEYAEKLHNRQDWYYNQ